MKRIILLVTSLIISAQAVCVQVSDVEKKKLEEQVVLAIKKYEGLGFSTEQLAEKVAADLLVQAQALQDGVVVEEKSNFNKKLIIGAVVAVAVCGVGYYVYTTYFAEKPLEKKSLAKAYKELSKASGYEMSSETIEDIRKMSKDHPEFAQKFADEVAKLVPNAAGKNRKQIQKELKKAYLAAAGKEAYVSGMDFETLFDIGGV